MILKRGSLGDKNNVEREFLVEHYCIIHHCVANALFQVHECVGNYTLPLDHSVLVRSDICQLGYHGDTWDYVWPTC